jgi:hypothetical protein
MALGLSNLPLAQKYSLHLTCFHDEHHTQGWFIVGRAFGLSICTKFCRVATLVMFTVGRPFVLCNLTRQYDVWCFGNPLCMWCHLAHVRNLC